LERHEFSSQAFIPMCGTTGPRQYLVLVALPGPTGAPDISTLRAFIAAPSQGVSYHPNIWHHPLIALGESQGKMDFACIVNETGVGEIDVEILEWVDPVATVVWPNLVPGRGS